MTAKPTAVSNVGLEDARIINQIGNSFNISFTITNGEGVKYGVQLLPEGTKYYVVDEQVYKVLVSFLWQRSVAFVHYFLLSC